MNKSTKIAGIAAVAIVLIAGIGFAVVGNDADKDQTEASTSQQANTDLTPSAPEPAEPTSEAAATQGEGRYTTYSQNAAQDGSYDTSVVFFHAPWCVECRAFKEAIQSDTIPAGTQILEADYDSSTELKKQYGVTLQSTFVRINSAGELQSKWSGYGKDKTLAAVLENLQ